MQNSLHSLRVQCTDRLRSCIYDLLSVLPIPCEVYGGEAFRLHHERIGGAAPPDPPPEDVDVKVIVVTTPRDWVERVQRTADAICRVCELRLAGRHRGTHLRARVKQPSHVYDSTTQLPDANEMHFKVQMELPDCGGEPHVVLDINICPSHLLSHQVSLAARSLMMGVGRGGGFFAVATLEQLLRSQQTLRKNGRPPCAKHKEEADARRLEWVSAALLRAP